MHAQELVHKTAVFPVVGSQGLPGHTVTYGFVQSQQREGSNEEMKNVTTQELAKIDQMDRLGSDDLGLMPLSWRTILCTKSCAWK